MKYETYTKEFNNVSENIRHVKVGEFEKVSYEQFHKAMYRVMGETGDVFTNPEIKKFYDAIELPARATSGSAGYDFKSPIEFMLEVGETMNVPTGIRVKVTPGWFLGCFPRSGLGFKYRMQLDNTVGIIDSDYYYSENEGHIWLKVTNDGKENKFIEISAGQGFAQGIFMPYGITYSDNAKCVRNGGFGSTDK